MTEAQRDRCERCGIPMDGSFWCLECIRRNREAEEERRRRRRLRDLDEEDRRMFVARHDLDRK